MIKRRLPDDMNSQATPQELRVFADNLRRARKKAGLTQQAITDKTGFAQSFISEVENARSTINIVNMAKLAEAVGVPLWKLLQP